MSLLILLLLLSLSLTFTVHTQVNTEMHCYQTANTHTHTWKPECGSELPPAGYNIKEIIPTVKQQQQGLAHLLTTTRLESPSVISSPNPSQWGGGSSSLGEVAMLWGNVEKDRKKSGLERERERGKKKRACWGLH